MDQAAVLVWSDQAVEVNFRSHRFDEPLEQTRTRLLLHHPEPRHQFLFAAAIGRGEGHLRHCHFVVPEQPTFTQARLAAGQALAIGAGLADEPVGASTASLAEAGPEALLAATERALEPVVASGRTVSRRHPHLASLRDSVVRGLHSMIDESGAFRASLKAIYYLLWVRDSGFSFPYHAAAGWPHKLPELCRLLLDNPNHVTDPGLPHGRMFGQLIHRKLGKLEEDGLFYVVRVLFTLWTHRGCQSFLSPADEELLDEALDWVEKVTWDEQRGLYGEFTADETPAHKSRDEGWDYAVGKPAGPDCLRFGDQPVLRNYDIYFNTCMHSLLVMLAAMRGQAAPLAKARRLWIELEKLLHDRRDGIPCYGELLLGDGRRVRAPYWGPPAGASCCVWGLSMPNFLPLADWDSVHAAVLDALSARPEMHFINGINAALAAVDCWFYPEEKCLAFHERLARETARPGKYLPMGGAMPEKFGAPEGSLHHDIRPQGFAMGSWLAAWSGLGLRRLPYGFALRPTSAFERIENFAWREGCVMHCLFGPAPETRGLALEVDGRLITGTLQIPFQFLRDGAVVRLVEAAPRNLLLRSSFHLENVAEQPGCIIYEGRAHGLTRLTFSEDVQGAEVLSGGGQPIDFTLSKSPEPWKACHLDFEHFGAVRVRTASS
ncbi:MAG: hypothetical protein N2322_00565 [Terrimicrobiaceae bacterium]|nr:hypothetical protein [Terrimicrobiaceae bacterium]